MGLSRVRVCTTDSSGGRQGDVRAGRLGRRGRRGGPVRTSPGPRSHGRRTAEWTARCRRGHRARRAGAPPGPGQFAPRAGQEPLYEDIPRPRRIRLHGKVVDTLEATRPGRSGVPPLRCARRGAPRGASGPGGGVRRRPPAAKAFAAARPRSAAGRAASGPRSGRRPHDLVLARVVPRLTKRARALVPGGRGGRQVSGEGDQAVRVAAHGPGMIRMPVPGGDLGSTWCDLWGETDGGGR